MYTFSGHTAKSNSTQAIFSVHYDFSTIRPPHADKQTYGLTARLTGQVIQIYNHYIS